MSYLAFGLHTPQDLFAKLRRELVRFEAATSHESTEHRHQSDLAFNCAVTAWHLVDWTWQFRRQDQVIASKIPGHFRFQDFHALVRNQCESLDICHEIATGAKHVRLDQKANPVVEAATKCVVHDSGIARSIAQPIVRPVARPIVGRYEEKLTIRLNSGQHVSASEVFSAAADYWERFLYAQG
jgi:hypothetical protein